MFLQKCAWCSKCQQFHPIKNFACKGRSRQNYCRACSKEYQAEYKRQTALLVESVKTLYAALEKIGRKHNIPCLQVPTGVSFKQEVTK